MNSLLLDGYPLIILPDLAVAIGLNEAVVLQQLHYWLRKSDHVHDGYRWVYNTMQQWGEQFPFWSVTTVKRTLAVLRKPYAPRGDKDGKAERGALVLVARFNKAGFDKTNWYTIDYSELESVAHSIGSKWPNGSGQCGPMGRVKMNQPIPETTQRLHDNDGHGAVSTLPVITDQDQLLATWSLVYLGVDKGIAKQETRRCDPGLVIAWCAALHSRPADNLPGLILSKLRADPLVGPVVYPESIEGFSAKVRAAIPNMTERGTE